MLKRLFIKNFALIDILDISFNNGFSVITGETGAGKSIILGAIGLLLGQRADSKSIKTNCDKCIIEAHFDLSRYNLQDFFTDNDVEYDAADCIIRRELTSTGKSRAFINDTPTSLALLKELGDKLVDVHSQHQNLLLNKQDFQLNLVDTIADDAQDIRTYTDSYNVYCESVQRLATLKVEIERHNSNVDFLQYQYDELAKANLTEGEQEALEQKAKAMNHSEEIKSAFYTTDNTFNSEDNGIVKQMRIASNAINSIEKLMPQASELADRINSCYIELKDIATEISSLSNDIDFDPAELDRINSRLDKIYDLEKKYRCSTVEELIDVRNNLKQQLSDIENSDTLLQELTDKVGEEKGKCISLANKLTSLRQKAAKKIETEISARLSNLGIPNARFEISMTKEDLGKYGRDKVSFLFSANKNTTLQPISQVASGGEIARVMLSLKAMISGFVKLPTIIFDEIDTGVSGKIAEKMAEIMQEMGDGNRQVISITHLPQIAALGRTHYKVSKEDTPNGTISNMTMLDNDGRIREIAQMLSGSDVTEAAINNARELLKL